MALPLGDGWWKCCKCTREINKDLHGGERCPDCQHSKCGDCKDPYDRPSDWADLSPTQSCSFDTVDDAAGLVPCDGSLLGEDTTVIWPLAPKEAAGPLQTESLVDSTLSLKQG
jgi:hypothetical protein